ncbi:prephenate dehydratase [Gordonia sp. OPL2]|uniref:prephenate dehydratase n=1 Tax=Gordonia sp. OPL2 TaxID=2486274 RepID=UPI0016560822|nr:prephenate dehydratase [Gordonia sp. OPL2]RPA12326.1 prephenate dehydratase [Gordonia sp. OPL2]
MSVFAYFGPSGTFTEIALDKLLSERLPRQTTPRVTGDNQKIAANSPAATIEMVRGGVADFGCVPIESSVEGAVPATADALVPPGPGTAGRVQAFAEVILDVAFTIAAREPMSASEVRSVAAYPVAAAQVRESVEKLYPQAGFVNASSNAGAAADVAAGRADVAVTTSLAAEIAGLTVLADGVADADDAHTRFLLIGPPGPTPERTGADRTSVILDLPNVPGSLMAAMNEYASRGIDLTRIESRPRREVPGSHRFYLDAVGHIDDDAVGEALRALYRRCERVVFLGSWPVDRTTGAPPPDTSDSIAWFDGIRIGEAQ